MVPGMALLRVILPMSRGPSGPSGFSITVVFWPDSPFVVSTTGTSKMVTVTASEWVSVPSSAVSVKATVVLALTCGAVKVGDSESALVRLMSSVESWLHE